MLTRREFNPLFIDGIPLIFPRINHDLLINPNSDAIITGSGEGIITGGKLKKSPSQRTENLSVGKLLPDIGCITAPIEINSRLA